MEPVISFKNVSKTYVLYHNLVGLKNFLFNFRKALRDFRNSRFQALKKVSFDIYPGERIGFIGANGAGKSTILSLIAGVLQADEGTVIVREKVSPLLELGSGFHPELTGRENIYLNGVLLGMRKAQVEEKVDSIIRFADLGEFINHPIRTYSSGMKVRLGFSIAVHIDPKILLIDEILSVGDANFQQKSKSKIKEFISQGNTLVFVSHDLNSVREICNRVAWIEKGKIIEMSEDVEGIIERYQQEALL